MVNSEKVKKGLDLCLTGEPSTCKDCPYDAECKEARGIGPSPLRRDALELLKEQKHGHWIAYMYDFYPPVVTCSVCGCEFDAHVTKHKYCPECGARMDEEVKQGG